MDPNDPSNQQQPGQNFQPQQPQQPLPAPQQPIQNSAQPQMPVQQPPMQPQYPQQPAQYPQQPLQPVYANQPQGRKLPIKMISIIGGGLVGLLLLVILAPMIFSGDAYDLTEASADDLSFSASVPNGWETVSVQVGSLGILTATPADVESGDPTNLQIQHITSIDSAEGLSSVVERYVDSLKSGDFADNVDFDVSNVSSEETEKSDDRLVHRVHFDAAKGDLNYKVTTHYEFNQDARVIIAAFTYSPSYSKLANTVDAVVDSFKLKE